MTKAWILGVLILCLALGLTACSQAAPEEHHVSAASSSEETTNERTAFAVEDQDGHVTTLHLENGPILFIADWCPHCNDYLKSHKPAPNMRVVAVFPQTGETPKDMLDKTREKLNRAGWEYVPLYASMDPKVVDMVPTLVCLVEGKPHMENAFEVDETLYRNATTSNTAYLLYRRWWF